MIYLQDEDLLLEYIEGLEETTKSPKGIDLQSLNKLIENKYIIFHGDKNTPNEYRYTLSLYEVVPKIAKKLWIDLEVAGEELWNTYPGFITIEGKQFPAKTGNKQLLIKQYMFSIGNSVEKHQFVLSMIEKALSNKVLCLGIEKFITSEYWNTISDYSATTGDTSFFDY